MGKGDRTKGGRGNWLGCKINECYLNKKSFHFHCVSSQQQ